MTAVIEMFSTKGTEYLLILAYLALLVPFWRLLSGPKARHTLARVVDWFRVPADVAFHPGHTWAKRVAPDRVRIGLDDLAQAFVGRPDAITVPAVGATLARGDHAWTLQVDGHRLPMVAPVGGEVVAVNREVLQDPSLLGDAYEGGWLLEVRVPDRRDALRGLLTGDRARAWMGAAVDAVRARLGAELGPVMQDGGAPVSGFGRHLGEDWVTLANALFQAASDDDDAPAPAANDAELRP